MAEISLALQPIPCVVCGTIFTPRNNRQKYCSRKCKDSPSAIPFKKHYNQRPKGTGSVYHINNNKYRPWGAEVCFNGIKKRATFTTQEEAEAFCAEFAAKINEYTKAQPFSPNKLRNLIRDISFICETFYNTDIEEFYREVTPYIGKGILGKAPKNEEPNWELE